MTLTIQLSAEEETRLRAVALRQGIDPAECARRLLTEHLPSGEIDTAPAGLFARWEAEDGTDDPGEIDRRNQEWAELRTQLEANRLALNTREAARACGGTADYLASLPPVPRTAEEWEAIERELREERDAWDR